MEVNPAQIAAWLKLGENIVGSELVKRFLPQIGDVMKLSDAERAAVEVNIGDYDARIARAEEGASRLPLDRVDRLPGDPDINP